MNDGEEVTPGFTCVLASVSYYDCNSSFSACFCSLVPEFIGLSFALLSANFSLCLLGQQV